MKLSHLRLVLFAALSAVPVAHGLEGRITRPGGPGAPLSLKFNHLVLGNVARVLSARFSAPVTIAANATAPITGDFSALGLKQALGAAALQAGLVVQSLGGDDSAGYALILPTDATAVKYEAPSPVKTHDEVRVDLAKANQRREQLLRERAQLLDDAARLEP